MSAAGKKIVNATVTPSRDSTGLLPSRCLKFFRGGILALVLAAAGWLWWSCAADPNINFLPGGAGEWILYPSPENTDSYAAPNLSATFRRAFTLTEIPGSAIISWRAFKQSNLTINGQPISTAPQNWKKLAQLDIAKYLRQGTNELVMQVANRAAPPALSLTLHAGNFSLRSDGQWEVSLAGAVWRHARLASARPIPGKGNRLDGAEETGAAFRQHWPQLLFFLALSVMIFSVFRYCARRARTPVVENLLRKGILILIGALWALLLLHNFRVIPPDIGYDAEDHLHYIQFIQEKKSLPAANEGWEMFQPPLYYAASAGLLGVFQSSTSAPGGIFLLHLFSLGIGAANLIFIFASLRLLFPGAWKKQMAGLLLAAFVPAHLYLLHYPTNETLAATLVTGALYFCLKILREENPATRWPVAVGIFLGAALMSKASALVAVPFVFAALIGKLILQRKWSPQLWLRMVALPIILTVAIGGWHYWKLWNQFGNPLIGNWDPKLSPPWWQAPGYHISAHYFSFGESLVRPLFSSLHSFPDGIYSTLWGEGLCGGRTDLFTRTPWNYDLMTIGFILALVPTTVVLIGFFRAVANCFRAPQVERLLLVGLPLAFAFSIFYMALKIPSYAQIKAFYGLSALLPFCFFGVLGLEFLIQRGKFLRTFFCVGLIAWLINLYASFWIRPDAPPTQLASAIVLAVDGHNDEAIAGFTKVLQLEPHNSEAIVSLAKVQSGAGHFDRAISILEQGKNPGDGLIYSELALDLALQGKTDESIVCAERAVELAPENPTGAQTLAASLLRAKKYEASIAAGRVALGILPTDTSSRFNLGMALIDVKSEEEAIGHFLTVLEIRPDSAEAHYFLGMALARQGKHTEALPHIAEAVRLAPENSDWRAILEKLQKIAGRK